MPTEVIISQADIDDIAKKLDEFGAVLNDREKTVILGALRLAGESLSQAAAAKPSSPPGGSSGSSLPSLSSGFRNAFQKGVGARFVVDTSQTEGSTSVGGTVSHTFAE